jgi:hypothetical protein
MGWPPDRYALRFLPSFPALMHGERGLLRLSTVVSSFNLHEFPLKKREDVEKPGRPKVIGPHLLGNGDWNVPRHISVGVIDWFQDDFDRVVHLGRAPQRVCTSQGLVLAETSRPSHSKARMIPAGPLTIAVNTTTW